MGPFSFIYPPIPVSITQNSVEPQKARLYIRSLVTPGSSYTTAELSPHSLRCKINKTRKKKLINDIFFNNRTNWHAL